MKERIVIDREKVIAFRPKGLDVYSQEYVEEIDVIENTKKVEQVPESFAELKVLCKKIDINKSDNEIEIKLNDNDYLHFYKNGYICCMNEDNEISLGYNIPPNRGWQVIKALIGE